MVRGDCGTRRQAPNQTDSWTCVRRGDDDCDPPPSATAHHRLMCLLSPPNSIVQFSGWDEMKKPGASKYNTLSTPERVAFALRCLEACDRELAAFFAAFPRPTVDEAQRVYGAYFAPPVE